MDLADLNAFVQVVKLGSLNSAARHLNQSTSALSKTIKRLEASLNLSLFERVHRQMRLNRSGQQLLERAGALLMHAELTRAAVMGSQSKRHLRVGGPALLLWHVQSPLQDAIRQSANDGAITLKPMFEDQALLALLQNQLDLALVSSKALSTQPKMFEADFQALPLGSTQMRLFAAAKHPLLAGRKFSRSIRLSSKHVLSHDFVCPSHSLICGIPAIDSADGWRTDALPRAVRYWIDDLQLLMNVVQSGQALAYLPHFVGVASSLVRIELSDCGFECHEELYLVAPRQGISGWLQRCVDAVLARKM
jgi:DNA-binding transcriptional LysR family regulator